MATPLLLALMTVNALSGRRPFLTASALTLVSAPTVATARPAPSDGKWARHEGEFTAEDLSGFSQSPSGLKCKIVEEGYGAKPQKGQGISAHYAGYFLDGKKFDSSYFRGSPLGFNVGTGRVIKGWDEALLDMKVGEKRMLVIPPDLAYGVRSCALRRPPPVPTPTLPPSHARRLP